MAKKEKLVYPNPKFWKAKDNMDWKKQGDGRSRARTPPSFSASPGSFSRAPTGRNSARIA